MGLNIRKKILVSEKEVKLCFDCNKMYYENTTFCPTCGKKVSTQKTKIFANMGKNGISSYSYKLPNGVTINSKGTLTFPIAQGISFTTKKSK